MSEARSEAGPKPQFQIVRNLPMSARVAQQLEDAIVAGTFKPGDALPTERELGEMFGVSRTVVREAVKSLTAKGMLAGSGRGIKILGLESKMVADSLSLYLRGRGGVDYSSVHEIRTLLERRIARLAATRGTDEQIEELTIELGRMRAASDPETASFEDVAFHRMLAAMTGNPLFPVLLDSIGEILLEIRRATLKQPGRSAQAIEQHEAILEQIVARDAEGAERAMKEHLADSYRIWEAAGLTDSKRTRRRRTSKQRTEE